ncbi:MAG: energy transducer TonB, partial [Methylocella sp.]
AQGRRTTVAQQLAALSPAPNYSLGAAAKAAPVSGGTEKASYESLLFGLITRQFHLPPEARARHLINVGQIGLFVDELGNLTHQAVYRASGDPALDTAWLAAVRRAAPFPAPPRGLPHGFILQYSNQD